MIDEDDVQMQKLVDQLNIFQKDVSIRLKYVSLETCSSWTELKKVKDRKITGKVLVIRYEKPKSPGKPSTSTQQPSLLARNDANWCDLF